MTSRVTLPLLALAVSFLALPSQAAIVLSGNFQTGTPTPTLEITEDIEFEITNSSIVAFLIFDQWTISDGVGVAVQDNPTQSVFYSLNGNPDASDVIGNLTDNFTSTAGAVTPGDGLLRFNSGIAVTSGDTLTIRAGTYTFESNADFNPLLNDYTFTGDVFLINSSATQISNIVSVPEPSSVGLLAVGMAALLVRRRKS